MFTQNDGSLFSLLLDADDVGERKTLIENEALSTCNDRRWCSMIHILALSSVLDTQVTSVYPEANDGIRPMFHATIQPESRNSHSTVLSIMWSRDGNLDNRDGAVFQPNHFVALLLRGNKTVTDTNKITNKRKDEKQKDKSSKKLRTDNKTQQKLPAFFTNAAPTLKNACHQEPTLTGEKSGSTQEEAEVNNDVTEEHVKSTANIQSWEQKRCFDIS